MPGVFYYYVIEAEDSRGNSACPMTGPSFGGASTIVCVDPPVEDFADTIGPDSDIGWTLRLSDGTEDSAFLYWAEVGLVDGEKYRVGRSESPMGRPFDDESRGPMRDPDFLDRRAPNALYFYDVRVVEPSSQGLLSLGAYLLMMLASLVFVLLGVPQKLHHMFG